MTDVFPARADARGIAQALRAKGWDANVETSGPPGNREYRVVVWHPELDDTIAYVETNDNPNNFQPYWIRA